MKVLMFGWEFPPHISGGLGTACAGLTRALVREHVKILFTIPRLYGDEQVDETTFINASEIPIALAPAETSNHEPGPLRQVPVTGSTEVRLRTHVNVQEETTVIEVPSFLSAYAAPGHQTSGLQRWSYTFEQTTEYLPAMRDSRPPESDAPATPPGVTTQPYPFSGKYGHNLLEEVDRYARVAAEIGVQHEFDVIHAHDWMTFPAGLAASRASGKPLIVHVHATEVDRSGKHVNKNIFEIEKQGMMFADKVVTVSAWTRDIAIRHYGIDAGKIEVVHNGIESKEAPGVFSPPPLNAPVVTFLGRITYQKGPMYFVEAARRVHEHFPDAHFVVAGAGDQLPAMITRIAELKMSGHFHFTGFLRGEEIDRVWAMSSVYVMPSVSEPFGIAPLEAIQAGVPVIVSRQTGVSEVMRHAIKIDFWDRDALAEAICNILRFKSLANTLRTHGVEEIKSITWEKAAKKITNLYEELTGRNRTQKEPDHLLSGTSAPPPAQAAIL